MPGDLASGLTRSILARPKTLQFNILEEPEPLNTATKYWLRIACTVTNGGDFICSFAVLEDNEIIEVVQKLPLSYEILLHNWGDLKRYKSNYNLYSIIEFYIVLDFLYRELNKTIQRS